MLDETMLTPMLRLTDEEITAYIEYGVNLFSRSVRRNRREYLREETQYAMYADDWDREGDD